MNDFERKLKELGISYVKENHPYLEAVADVQNYLGLTLADGFSTLIMKTDVEFVAIIRRDDCRLDFGKLRKLLKCKHLGMASDEEFVKITKTPVGAAHIYNPGLTTYLDKRLFEKEFLIGGTGSFEYSFKYRSEELKKIPNSTIVDVTEDSSNRNKIVFSGIQPSGDLHIGNYIGAVRQWVKGQDDGLNIFCVVDLHAITVPQDPKILAAKTREITAILLAAGIDPAKSLLFVQSHNPDHANLGWVLNCYLSMGQMSRMIQYKEKSQGKDFVSVGLFDYPALMAADILLYDTTEVPVGEDQKQHVELTRDVAERFNSKYGQTFVLPEPKIPTAGGRVMSLSDPTKKMSKSDANPNGAIGLLEDPKSARKKIMSAVTDSGSEVKMDWANKPGISNLLEIYSQLSGQEYSESGGYGEFKTAVADVVEKFLVDFQKRYQEVTTSGKLESILANGAKKSYEISHPKLIEIYKKIGFLVPLS